MKNENFILCKDMKIMTNKKNHRSNLLLFSRYSNFRFLKTSLTSKATKFLYDSCIKGSI